jgi:hypothetical protein
MSQQLLAAYGGAYAGANDPFFAWVAALLHFDGTNGSTTFTDQKSNTWSRLGGGTTTALSNTQAKFGATSLGINATGPGGISTPNSSAFQTSGLDFCFEAWSYQTTYTNTHGNGGFLFARYNGNWGMLGQVLDTGALQLLANTTGTTGYDINITTSGSAVPLNQWNHIAFTRNGSTFRGFINGSQVGSTTNANALADPGSALEIGGTAAGSTLVFPGFIDDFRLTVGAARYAASFTVPAAAFPDS